MQPITDWLARSLLAVCKRAGLLAAAMVLTTSSAVAGVLDFDNGPIIESFTGGVLNTTDSQADAMLFTAGGVSALAFARLSTSNLCCSSNSFNLFAPGAFSPAEVYWDNDPAGFGGLGVRSSSSDDDNLEGSLNNNASTDEILFFLFGTMQKVNRIVLNGEHTDLVNATDEKWGLWTSPNGTNWSPYVGSNIQDSDGNLVATGNEFLFLDGIQTQWLAVSAVGPITQVGGYIEAIFVPEPASLTLLGLGLVGLGMRRRRMR